MKFRLEHELPADIHHAWATIMSEEFSTQSYSQSGIDRTTVSSEERNGKTYSVIQVNVREPLPPMAARVMGTSQLSWTQNQIIDHSTHTMQWQIRIPNADKVSASGIFKLVPRGGQCVRIVEGDVVVKMRLVGRKAEEHICAKLQKSYERSAAFTQEWLLNHPA